MPNEKTAAAVQAVVKEMPKETAVQNAREQVNRNTAITILDRSLGGGLPSGSVVYLYADPKSMAEVFLYQFTQARKTYYFSNERHPRHIIRDIQNYGFKINNIMFVDIYRAYSITAQGEMVDNVGNEFADAKIVEFTESTLNTIIEEGGEAGADINLIFDSFSFYLPLRVHRGG